MQVDLQQFVPAAFMPEQRHAMLNDIFVDSRDVIPGSGFIALRGSQLDGRKYIESAVKNGASLVFADAKDLILDQSVRSVVINIPELESHIAAMAADFYDHPSINVNTIAVTGTNGKTSVCKFIADAMSELHGSCAYMGTLGWGVGADLQPLQNTTPDVVSVQRILRRVVDQGARSIAMEVSSHGLHQGRIDNVLIDVAVFTNLSRDHLDYHGDMSAYAEVKRSLFGRNELQCSVINIDDEFGLTWYESLRFSSEVLSYSARDKADISLNHVEYSLNKTYIDIQTPFGGVALSLPVVGPFNVYNLLATCAVLCHYTNDLEKITQSMAAIKPVPGRMQLVDSEKPVVIVDYSHTPDGLEKALLAIKPHCKGNVWVVFGCGGDRDGGKRPLMAAVAERLADKVVVTSDNPRSESPQAIINQIMQGFVKLDVVTAIEDRYQAISFALSSAGLEDCVLLAGKGHETYQILNSGTIHFDDREVAAEILRGLVRCN